MNDGDSAIEWGPVLVLPVGLADAVRGPVVLVPARLAAELAEALAEHVRRRSIIDPGLFNLLGELSALARLVSDDLSVSGHPGRDPLPPGVEWVTVAEYAADAGLSERTVRRHCADGRLPTRRKGNRWMIATYY